MQQFGRKWCSLLQSIANYYLQRNYERSTIIITAFGPDTHPFYLHLTSNQQQLENHTAYVVTNAIVVSS